MGRSEFRVRMNGPVSIVEVHGPLDEEAATSLLEFAAAAATACPAVQIDLDGVESMTQDAAALLLFRRFAWEGALREDHPPSQRWTWSSGRLSAYALRRARSQVTGLSR